MTKLGWGAASNDKAMAAYLAMWGLFTLVMFIGTLRLNRALQFVFLSLTVLFFLLAYGDFANASPGFKHFTGYEGILCGFSAIYTGLAQVLNELTANVAAARSSEDLRIFYPRITRIDAKKELLLRISFAFISVIRGLLVF